MSDFEKDRDRWAKANWHWNKRMALHILKKLTADVEAMSDDGKMRIFPGYGPDGVPTLWLCTEDHEVYGPGYNQSTFCPPFCP